MIEERVIRGIGVKLYDTLPSTQIALLDQIHAPSFVLPHCVVARHQSNGIGSRGNTWESVTEGLYFSLALEEEKLPQDLAIQSASIYFGFCFKEALNEMGLKTWLKWPNDIYVGDKKVGGVLVNKSCKILVCGIGVNLFSTDLRFEALNQKIEYFDVLDKFFEKLQKAVSWKEIFRKYSVEFHKNFDFRFHHKDCIISLRDVVLLEDGALLVEGQKVYSLR